MRTVIIRKYFSEGLKNYTLPDLKYGYSELEPVISGKLLQIHYKKHHQTYINNLNNSLQQFEQAKSKKLFNKISTLCKVINFNLGGHINHSIYWENLSPISKGGGQLPGDSAPLTKAVNCQFGSYSNLIKQMTEKTVAIQGSGWGWLAFDQISKSLRIIQLPNQELLGPLNMVNLLTIDVWQHAYYLDYKNVRLNYLNQIWKIINWKCVQERYNQAVKKQY